MSRFPLLDLARDASVAVGAYVGMVRDRFWETLSNGDGFDERVARAKAEFAADRLADKEAEEEVAEPAETCRCGHPYPGHHVSAYGSPTVVVCDAGKGTKDECHCCRWLAMDKVPAAVPPFPGQKSPWHKSSSTGSPRNGAVEEPPEVEPTPPVKAPSGGTNADWLTGWLTACAELDVVLGADVWRQPAAQALREMAESLDPPQ